MILEAMKMEIDITAPQDGVIKSIDVNVNDAVNDGQLLATME
jgi:pyruvate carboxylase subunit B